VKKILIALVVIMVIVCSVWIMFPANSIQSIIEDSVTDKKLNLEIKGLKKGLFYNLSAESIILKSSGQKIVSLTGIHGKIDPISLTVLRPKIIMNGNIGSGNFSGTLGFAKNKVQVNIDFKQVSINDAPFFSQIGIRGEGTVSGKIVMTDNKGNIEFVTKDANLGQAEITGVSVPLNYFHSVTGIIDINGNLLSIGSLFLEGKDINARLKGIIKNDDMDLKMEIMPGKSFAENPLFISGLEIYKISPGYYVIPVKGNLSF
jgi:type II secretion system protein N